MVRVTSKKGRLNPKVTIVIAAYNASKSIKRAIASGLQQSHTNIEILLIDDGSTDATLERVKEFDDARLRVVSQPNKGQGFARNRGVRMAEGDYITILDADDALVSDAIEKMLDLADVSDEGSCHVDLIIGGWQRHDSATGRITKSSAFVLDHGINDLQDIKAQLLRRTTFSVAKLYRRDWLLAEGVTFGEAYIYEDLEFVVGAVLRAQSIAICPSLVYEVYSAPASSSRSQTETDWHAASFEKALTATIAKYFAELAPFRKSFVSYVLSKAYQYAYLDARVPRGLRFGFVRMVIGQLMTFFPERWPPNGSVPKRFLWVIRAGLLSPALAHPILLLSMWMINRR